MRPEFLTLIEEFSKHKKLHLESGNLMCYCTPCTRCPILKLCNNGAHNEPLTDKILKELSEIMPEEFI